MVNGLRRCLAGWLAAGALLLAASAAWAADPASVMPSDADIFVALDLDAAQRAADDILPPLGQDYWAKPDAPGRQGLAVLSSVAPLLHSALATVRSAVGPRVGVGLYDVADLSEAYLSSVTARSGSTGEKEAESDQPPDPEAVAEALLPHLNIVIAAQISDPKIAKPLLEGLAARMPRADDEQGEGDETDEKVDEAEEAEQAGEAEKAPGLYVHVGEQWALLATSPERLEQAKAVMAGEQPSLASQPVYREIIAALPAGTAFFYSEVARYGPAALAHAQKMLEKVFEQREESQEAEKAEQPSEDQPEAPEPAAPTQQEEKRRPNAGGMKRFLALYTRIMSGYYGAVRGMGSTVRFDREGWSRRDVYLVDPEKMAQVPLLGPLSEPVPLTGAALGALPQSAVAVIAAGGVGRQAGTALQEAVKLDPWIGMAVGMGKGMVGGFLGLDVEKDLLPAAERDFALALLAVDVSEPMPVQVALLLQGRDEAAVSALAARLDGVVTERFEAKLERGRLGPVAFREVRPARAPFTLCYAQVDDLLLVTTGRAALQACLDARSGRSPALRGDPEIARLGDTPWPGSPAKPGRPGGASMVGLARARTILEQAQPIMPPQMKALVGEGIGLDWAAMASGGTAAHQQVLLEVRGDAVTLAETVAQGVALGLRAGLLHAGKREAPEPAPQEPEQ